MRHKFVSHGLTVRDDVSRPIERGGKLLFEMAQTFNWVRLREMKDRKIMHRNDAASDGRWKKIVRAVKESPFHLTVQLPCRLSLAQPSRGPNARTLECCARLLEEEKFWIADQRFVAKKENVFDRIIGAQSPR
jgi:hypothetical protein